MTAKIERFMAMLKANIYQKQNEEKNNLIDK